MSYTLSSALHTANRLIEILTPVCVPGRLHIAGSIRRKYAEVKDIEIVCQPQMVLDIPKNDLFPQESYVLSPEFTSAIQSFTDHVIKGKPDGRYMQILLKGGKPLDLFMPQPDDYFRQLIIRTGSANYVHCVIAASWKQKGWCGVPNQGLRLMSECIGRMGTDNKTIWSCIKKNPTLPPAWQSEEEVFHWLGLPFTPPECRELKTTLNHYQ